MNVFSINVYGEEQQKKRVSMMSDHSPFRTPQIRHEGFGGGAGSAGSGVNGSNTLPLRRPGSGAQGGSARREGSSGPRGSSLHSSLPSPASAASRLRSAGRGWPHSPSPATTEQLKMIAKRRLGAMGSGSGF